MATPIRVLIVEDSDNDKELLLLELRQGGYDPVYLCVETAETMISALDQHEWDIIISDYSMPKFNGLEALEISKNRKLDIPFILVSGTIGEEIAVNAMKQGANDYLMKGNLSRLIPALERELKDTEVRRQRNKVEEALKKNEEMLSLVLNSIPQSIFWKDRNSIYLGCNKVFAKAAGFNDPDLVVGKSDFDLPWKQEESEAYRKDDMEVIDSQKPKIHIIETIHQFDGKKVWIDTTKIPLKDIRNRGYGVLGIFDDITEQKISEEALKESELRFRTLAESAPVGIFRTDANGETNYVNSRWCEISQLSFEGALRNGWLNAVHPDDRDILDFNWRQTTTERASSRVEYRFLHPDGSIAWVIGQAVPQKDENGQTLGYIGTVTDITERKLMEADMIASKEKAEESDRLKTAFLHNISHEIRTPLNSIVGFSRLITEPDLEQKDLDKYAEIINRSSDNLLSIITDIIQIATIEAGQEKIHEKEINLNTLCAQLQNQFMENALKQNITLTFINSLNDDPYIIGDGAKLAQVLSNLIGNAVKFTKQGTVVVGCGIKGSNLEFYIEDNGIGIAPEMHEEIFKRFRQVESAATRNYGGSGLGLAISKAIIELLGGHIWVESEIGEGSKFCFTIPYKQPSRPLELITKKNINMEQYQNQPKKRLKILITEDEDAVDYYFSVILKNIGREILHTKNGLEAIEVCRNNKDIDLVLMDIKMPEMNGYEATREIRKFDKDIIIIAQTAYALIGDREKAIDAGCNDYISKPIKREALMDLIGKYFK